MDIQIDKIHCICGRVFALVDGYLCELIPADSFQAGVILQYVGAKLESTTD